MPVEKPSPNISRWPAALSFTVPTASVMSFNSDCTWLLFAYMPPRVMPACVNARRALMDVASI
eukprot:6213302-Pleurochrysis_carterae.AAC.1